MSVCQSCTKPYNRSLEMAYLHKLVSRIKAGYEDMTVKHLPIKAK